MAFWIIELDDGTVLQSADEPGTMGTPEGVRSAELVRTFDTGLETYDWATGAIVPLLEAWRSRLLADIDAQRCSHAEPLTTAGQAVHYAYTVKAAELYNYDVLLAAQVPGMTAEQLAATFPWISEEAAQLGIPLADAMARVRAARVGADAALRAIEAKAQAAKVAVRAAETLEDMQTAAAVNWEN